MELIIGFLGGVLAGAWATATFIGISNLDVPKPKVKKYKKTIKGLEEE